MRLSRTRIVLASHYFTSGPANELEEYLSSKAAILLTIFHPFPDSKVRHDVVTEFIDGKIVSRKMIAKSRVLPAFGYGADLLSSLILPFLSLRQVDLYIGSNPINALAGLILRKLRLVQKVIFYKIDYVPQRFGNLILNRIYHGIDDYCSR